MTRREITKELFIENEQKLPLDKIPITVLVDKIYDDLESRTCINCKFYKSGTCSNKTLEDVIFPNMEVLDDSGLYLVDFEVEPSFGCNKFSRKDK